MLRSNLEYIPLRIIRKFLFTEKFLTKFSQFIPYYQTNINQSNPSLIVDNYAKFLDKNITLNQLRILEIGAGATNSTGYEMVARQWGQVILFEPYAEFNEYTDTKLFDKYFHYNPFIKENVKRVDTLSKVEDNSIDLVLSSSVLEHVLDPEKLFLDLTRVSKKEGVMLHLIDYRDHFFKYPYHFLQFSKKSWNRFLNPGDLPGWRLSDHLKIFKKLGFSVTFLEKRVDETNFCKIKPHVSEDYDVNDPDLKVIQVVAFIKFLGN